MRNWTVLLMCLITLPLQAGVQGDLRSGGQLYKHKKYGQALVKYNQILQKNPTQQEAAFGAGAAAYYLKDYDAAQAAFTQAAEQNTPRQTDALFNLGNAYYRAKNTEKAQHAYRQTILKNPQDKEAIHNLQLLLEEQSQQNQNNQNNDNKNDNSSNQQPQGGQNQQQGEQEKQDSQQQQQASSQADQEAAQRVMQMAQDQEAKQQPQHGGSAADDLIEKDW